MNKAVHQRYQLGMLLGYDEDCKQLIVIPKNPIEIIEEYIHEATFVCIVDTTMITPNKGQIKYKGNPVFVSDKKIKEFCNLYDPETFNMLLHNGYIVHDGPFREGELLLVMMRRFYPYPNKIMDIVYNAQKQKYDQMISSMIVEAHSREAMAWLFDKGAKIGLMESGKNPIWQLIEYGIANNNVENLQYLTTRFHCSVEALVQAGNCQIKEFNPDALNEYFIDLD